LIPNDQLRSI
uniref:Cryptide Pep-3 n=1 Tax=Tityus obscurus TaxID=1221240 RepID=CRY3_TITOB